MFNGPVYYIVLLSVLLALVVLLVRIIIQRRKDDKVIREYMAKMDELRKQKSESEAKSQTQHNTDHEKKEPEKHSSGDTPKDADYIVCNEHEKKERWTDKIPIVLKTIVKWYLIIAFFPFSLLYLLYRANEKIYPAEKQRYEEQKKNYEKTERSSATQEPYDSIYEEPGAEGEFLLYQELSSLEEEGAKFLFNTYLPKGNGKTTEIDIICICHQGIFVFESKDYSGWIFGSEKQKTWTQTLARKGGVEKFGFYNPVMQNKTHIKYLRSYLQRGKDLPVWSVIVFSNHCELKQIKISSKDVFVVQRWDVYSLIRNLMNDNTIMLSDSVIEHLYQRLYPLTQVSDEVKTQHNINVQRAREQ